MAFYAPIIKNIWSLSVFCFMDEGLEEVLERSDQVFSEHLEKIIVWIKHSLSWMKCWVSRENRLVSEKTV